MDKKFELKIVADGAQRVVDWHGKTGEDAARRYVDCHREATVVAWREADRHGVFPYGGERIIG